MGSSAIRLEMLELEDRCVPLRVKRHLRARRISLRMDPEGEGLHLVLPRAASLAEGLAFAKTHRHWIETRMAALPPRRPFAVGQRIPVRGLEHEIVHRPGARRGVWLEEGTIGVSGDERFLPRRVADFLKREARGEISQRVLEKTALIDQRAGRVTLRDTKSRWGSCSAKGDLSFSWRLILAPITVLDYVVAHEVAHLAEHNHSRRFWRLAEQLSDDLAGARRWLAREGSSLMRYGDASRDWEAAD